MSRYMASSDKAQVVAPYMRFLGGAAAGGFLVLLPLLYSEIGTWHKITGLQLGLILLVVISCGLLSVKLGTGFIEAIMNGFENSGF